MPSNQATRRAAAKARCSARDRVTMPSDSAKGAGKGQPSSTTPELRCACCAAGSCANTARKGLDELRARFGHAIQVVADPVEDEAFLYTVGANPEFLVEDVPKKYVQEVARTMNALVDRVNSGRPVQHGHTIGANGVLFVAAKLQGATLRQALMSKCTACDHNAQVVQLQPVLPQCAACEHSGDDAGDYGGGGGYVAFGGEGHRLGTS